MSEKNYEIGEIIYLVSNKVSSSKTGNQGPVVFPAIIQEENVRKTRDGNKITYKVLIGNESRNKLVDMAKVDGEIYGSLDEVKTMMVEKLEQAKKALIDKTNEQIHKSLSRAAMMAKTWYGVETEEFEGQEYSPDEQQEDEKIDPAALLDEVSGKTFRQGNPQPPQYVRVDGNYAVPYQQGGPVNYQDNRINNSLRNQIEDPGLRERIVYMPDGSVRKIQG